MMRKGLRLAAIYGFPSSRLGFCGKGNKKNLKILSEFITGNQSLEKQTRKILSTFEAAFSYYKLIAKCSKTIDPFHEKVVGAYWLGNKLLKNVKTSDLKKMIVSDFTKPGLLSKKQARQKADKIPQGVAAHHSFHVLFIGSITGRIKLNDKLLDVCRVGWGRVIDIKKQKAKSKNELRKLIVKYKPLVVGKNKYYLGKPIKKEIIWDKRFLSKVKIEDTVSFHWNKACQVLTKKQKENLEKYTRKNLRAIS